MFINSELYEACPASCNHTGAKTRPNTHTHDPTHTHRHAGLSLHCQHPALTSYQPSSLLKPICNMSKCIWQCPKSEAFRLFFGFKVLRFLLTIQISLDNEFSWERDICWHRKYLILVWCDKLIFFTMYFHLLLWVTDSEGQRGDTLHVSNRRDNSTKLQQQGHTIKNTHPCQGPCSGRSLWRHSHTSCFHTVHSPSILCFYCCVRNVPPHVGKSHNAVTG